MESLASSINGWVSTWIWTCTQNKTEENKQNKLLDSYLLLCTSQVKYLKIGLSKNTKKENFLTKMHGKLHDFVFGVIFKNMIAKAKISNGMISN